MEVSVEYPSRLEVHGVHRNEGRIWLGLLCLYNIQCAQLDPSDYRQAVCEERCGVMSSTDWSV